MIQDTSFVIDIFRGEEEAIDLLEVLEKESRPQKVSSITVLELYEGMTRSDAPKKEQNRILNVLETKSVVEADRAIMRKAGKISGELFNKGNQIDREDCIVASTALLNDEPVVTKNVDHFERIEEIELISY